MSRTTATILAALVSVASLTVIPKALASQEDSSRTGILTGRIRNAVTGRVIPAATVILLGTDRSETTDGIGEFRFGTIPPGQYRLQVRAIGYRPFIRTDLRIGSGRPLRIEVSLEPLPFELETIEVQPNYFQEALLAPTASETLEAEQVRRAPGVQEDVVRAVALLPGVGVTSGGRNDLIVRGGAPFENLFLVDGLAVPNINHFGSQGSTGGPLSLINIQFVDQAQFSSGGFGVAYGDRTASLTSIRLREGNREKLSAIANLSATGFGLIAEGPIGKRSSFLLGVRRSYLDLLFKLADFSFIPGYWDATAKMSYTIDARNRLSLTAIGAIDEVTFNNGTDEDREDNSRILAPDQKQYFAGLTWDHFLNQGRLTFTLGRTFTDFQTSQVAFTTPPQPLVENRSREGITSFRAAFRLQASTRLSLAVGNLLEYADDLEYRIRVAGSVRTDQDFTPQPLSVDTSFTTLRNATYGELTYDLSRRLRTTLGARLQFNDYLAEAWRVDPRLGLAYGLSPASSLTLTLGRFHQSPSFIWLVGDPGNAERLVPIQSDQIIGGYRRLLRPDLKLQIEGFYRRYRDYPARIFRPEAVLAPTGFEDATTDIPFGLEPLTSAGTGSTYGAELLIQKRFSDTPWYGLLSTSLARAEFASLEGQPRTGQYDTRLIVTLGAGYRLNRSWEIGAKWRLASGLPTTPYFETGPNEGRLDFSRYNEGQRLPTFHALDVRVDRRWSFPGIQFEMYLDIQNLYNRKNVSGVRWNFNDQQVEANESIGILPTIGINLEI
jgi:hypothetical protein